MSDKKFKSGFVAVLGRSNVGKSTLVNRLVGEKVAIVSPKPQTTRNKIAAILTTEDYQIIFEDTPGMHKAKSALSKFMKKSWEAASAETDIIVVVIDGALGLTDSDLAVINGLESKKCPVIAVVNKIDEAKPDTVMPALAELSKLPFLTDIIPMSAKTGENKELLLNKILSLLPEGTPYYGKEELTDKSERFMVSEIIREKVLLYFQQEIPHGVNVSIEKFTLNEEKDLFEIDAVLMCEKASHKPMLIGKGGASLKKIGSTARPEIEKLLGKQVYLTTWVKVKEDWRESDNLLRQMGYDNKKDI